MLQPKLPLKPQMKKVRKKCHFCLKTQDTLIIIKYFYIFSIFILYYHVQMNATILVIGQSLCVAENNVNSESDEQSQPQDLPTDAGIQCSLDTSRFSAWSYRNDSPGIHFYTGLQSYQKFIFVLSTLGPAQHELNYYHGVKPSLCVEDQFFMLLIKLRQHKTNFELSRMFRVTESTVTNVFVTWINFIYFEMKEIDWWPSSDCVKYFSPSSFKTKFSNTRVIVDGTECPIMKPKQPVAQQATFSTYKNRNTVKVLVGCTPGGLVSYVSPAYGGSTSDRQIAERSQLPQICDPGDSIMADKGFNVQDLFIPYNVMINIPSFFRKKNRLSGKTVISDRKIASKRVHIERIIGLAKTYKILTQPMSNTESALATQIITVCFLLCNFRTGIVPKYS